MFRDCNDVWIFATSSRTYLPFQFTPISRRGPQPLYRLITSNYVSAAGSFTSAYGDPWEFIAVWRRTYLPHRLALLFPREIIARIKWNEGEPIIAFTQKYHRRLIRRVLAYVSCRSRQKRFCGDPPRESSDNSDDCTADNRKRGKEARETRR